MAAAATGNNVSGNNRTNFAREEAETVAELAKLDMTNPGMLLDKLPSYGYGNFAIFLTITGTLLELSETKPDEFLASPALFPALHFILDEGNEELEGEVIKILKNISRRPDHLAILKTKLYREDPSNPAVNLLRALLIKIEIIPIFDMQAIMASETPHVYAMEGHGCVYDKRPPIIVPRGIIWIELTVCGLVTKSRDIIRFINTETKNFLENTPMPTDEASRQKYRADLGALTDYGIGVKFPGQSIADGTNNLFLQIFDGYMALNKFYKSGIHRLYTGPLNIDEYKPVIGTGELTNVENEDDRAYNDSSFDIPYEKIYTGSIYPTLEQVIRTKPDQRNYKITFQDLFAKIDSQDYEVRKPMILINSACRSPCSADSRLNAPALRRQNSEEDKAKTIRELPIRDLLRVGITGQTYLKSLIKQGLFGLASLLMERVEGELGLGALSHHLSEQRILDYIRYDVEPYLLREERKAVPIEFIELIKSKLVVESDIARKFEKLKLLVDTKRPEEWTYVFIEIAKLAKPQKAEFLAYEGLFDVLLRILDKKNKSMRGSIAGLMRTLAATDEDKARLAGQFHTIPAAEGVRGESIAELRAILKDRGVIAAGGTRRKRRRGNSKFGRTVRNRGNQKRV